MAQPESAGAIDVIHRGRGRHSAMKCHLFLGTFPPRQCGIAPFTQDVVNATERASRTIAQVVAVDSDDGLEFVYPTRVVARLQQHRRHSYARVADFINRHPASALNVQHEFGIFGGPDGEWVLDLLDRVSKPTLLTMHTALPNPSPQHRRLVERLCGLASKTVVLSNAARSILIGRYNVDSARVRVIPHGIPDVAFRPTAEAKRALGLDARFVLSTFGLLGRGKGIELAIDALAPLAKLKPNMLYLIIGAAHPAVLRSEGARYREELGRKILRRGLERNVKMIDRYVSLEELLQFLAASDVYVTPYRGEDQVVSGTLAYAVGLGKAVVSTPYLYARELLADGRGTLVPFGDSVRMGEAIDRLIADETYRTAMSRRAYAFGRGMIWPNVGAEYAAELGNMARPHPSTRPSTLATAIS